MISGALWKPKQDALLRDLWAREVLAKEIGARLNRSAEAVWRRAKRLGLPRRKRERRATAHIRVTFTREEEAAIRRVANKRGRSVAALVRQALVAHVGPGVLGRVP